MGSPDLILRSPTPEDVLPYLKFISEPGVAIWLEDRCQLPLSAVEIETFIFQHSWCPWSIDVDGSFAGLTGFLDPVPERGEARFFIVIGASPLWGKGLGTEVAKSVVAKGFEELGLRRIVSGYFKPNIGSRVIHERAGFRIEGVQREFAWRNGSWIDQEIVSILSHEYHESRPN
jgi:RimJ/RimL family protein N-acetyltransferase